MPVTAAARSSPVSSATSRATYGRRSASATVSTIAGNARSGSAAHSSRCPSRRIARHGSWREPYSSRLTVRWSRSRSGSATSAEIPVASRDTPYPCSGPTTTSSAATATT